MRAVSGCGHIRRVEQLAGAQRVAGADTAVADAEDLVLAVNIRDLVHKAVFLGTLAELTFHTDWMRYDYYVDLSGAVLGYLTEPMPVPELDGFIPAAFRSCCA